MFQAIAFHSNNAELQAAGAGVLRLLCSGHRHWADWGKVGYKVLGRLVHVFRELQAEVDP